LAYAKSLYQWMKIAFFDTRRFDREAFSNWNGKTDHRHELTFLEPRLTVKTAQLATGFACACCFVNDDLGARTLEHLSQGGVRLVALRSAGYNHVDLRAADRLGLRVVRVPAYSPHAVAEHAVALLLAVNRKIHRAHNRVRELNFSLEGLVGHDVFGKVIGVVGTGRIGSAFARIMHGFGCTVFAFDPHPNEELRKEGIATYVDLDEIYRRSHAISLHIPLTPQSHHMINEESLSKMRQGVYLVNTSRGALIDSRALIRALKSGKVGAAGLDVYEEEEGIFFQDLSDEVMRDDTLARLLTFPNVLVTAHQAFLTHEALGQIARTTLENITAFETGARLDNEVRSDQVLESAPHLKHKRSA